jgi:hypothetical protein
MAHKIWSSSDRPAYRILNGLRRCVMTIWQFTVNDKDVIYGNRKRRLLTPTGCNEPFKDSYWCPKKKWFNREPCPFINKRECENFALMSGEKYASM